MITTKQVRDIMRKYTDSIIYTNKVKAKNERSVKCYLPSDSVVAKKLLSELDAAAAGANYVNTYKYSSYYYAPLDSVTVRCVIA
jgi:hypothetical protein